jgi:cell wall-associated NlpC family hydrolase
MATPTDVAAPRAATARPRTARPRTARRVSLAVAGVLGVLLSTAPAQAAPGDPNTSAEASAMVGAKGHELEVVTERFNQAQETLTVQQAAAQQAAAQLEQATAALAAAQENVRGIARTAYTGESLGSFQALMTSDSADDFVDRIATLQTIASHQNGILGEAAAANVAAAEAQAAAQKSAADAQAQFDAVAKQQADLQAQVDEYKAAFDRLSAQEQRAAIEAAGTHGAADRASRDERQAPVPAGPVVASGPAAQIAVDTAMAQRGKPYVWAATGPGSFDCSGLVLYAYRAAGVSVPRSAASQAGAGQRVSRGELQPGDLVSFYRPISHIGIYIGNGLMVHAPTSGDVVKVASIDAMGTPPTAYTRLAG